jgi:hypothetical protein
MTSERKITLNLKSLEVWVVNPETDFASAALKNVLVKCKTAAEGGCAPQFLKTQPGRLCHTSLVRAKKLVFGNDAEGRDGSVKMAQFQLLHRPISLFLRREEMGYSGTFRFNQERNEV